MLLVINANNTNTVLAMCDVAEDRIVHSWRVATRRDQMPDEWHALLVSLSAANGFDLGQVSATAIASVVPALTNWLAGMSRHRLGIEPLIISGALETGVQALVDHPHEVGADRLANTVAAFERFGGPAIVVDFGTATNFDVVSADGAFLGGAIAPGIAIGLEALTARAARLFSVEIAFPDRAIATNTVTNIQSGTVLGHLMMVEGMIGRLKAELGTEATVIATGGQSAQFAEASPVIDQHAPNLTVDGIQLIYRRVRGGPEAAQPRLERST
jgi:type III pantothenate kinase